MQIATRAPLPLAERHREDRADFRRREVPLPRVRIGLLSIWRFRADHPRHRAALSISLPLSGCVGCRGYVPVCHPVDRAAISGTGAIRMRVLLKIRPIEPASRTIQLREALSWVVFYLVGAGLMMGLVFLVTGAFPR
jgi:hypothetical protein